MKPPGDLDIIVQFKHQFVALRAHICIFLVTFKIVAETAVYETKGGNITITSRDQPLVDKATVHKKRHLVDIFIRREKKRNKGSKPLMAPRPTLAVNYLIQQDVETPVAMMCLGSIAG